MLDSAFSSDEYHIGTDNTGNANLLQSYINYQHKFSKKFIFNGGIHTQHFGLTNSNAIEPRLGFKYNLNNRHSINAGAGLHSQIQPITVYFNEEEIEGEQVFPNQDLGFSKAIHNVLGYDFLITEHIRLKTEVYYQKLYNIPVDSMSSSFSMLNQGAGFVLPNGTGYKNEGTGTNYGVEITLEQFLNRGYYFLFTTSLFDSKFKGSDGIERNTAFNGNYIFNILGGKEFKLNKMLTLGFDVKCTYAGGKRYTPLDIEASKLTGSAVRYEDELYSLKHKDYFRLDFKTTIKLNGKKMAQEWGIDLQNLTNQDNIFQSTYNVTTQKEGYTYQRGFFPMVQYRINF